MWEVFAVAFGVLIVVLTVLPLSRSKAWWVRIWEFPRLQIGILGLLALAGLLTGSSSLAVVPHILLVTLLSLAVIGQFAAVWRYTRLAPIEVQPGACPDSTRCLSLVVCNVLQGNRASHRLVTELRKADADIILCIETDTWWQQQLDVLTTTHPYALRRPQPNTYGMLLYSRLPLREPSIEYLVQSDVPSFHLSVELRRGGPVRLHCLHPRPPVPGKADSSLPREAELLVVARRVRETVLPVIVCGDLNDVAWSRTTREFQKVTGLLDPRKGRGMFSTFHARWPGLRVPLDHIFHSTEFRLVALRRLRYVGSDHFPMHAKFSLAAAGTAKPAEVTQVVV